MMKLVGDPECPICGKPADHDGAFFPEYTDGLGLDPVRAMFHATAFHWECYFSWPSRHEFAGTLFARHVEKHTRSTLQGRAYVDQDIGVFVAVYEPMIITLIIRETGRSIFVTQDEWSDWQLLANSIAPQCHMKERDFLRTVLPRVWSTFHNKFSFEKKTDWSSTERHLYADV